MPGEMSIAETIGWALWYAGEIATKWIPGFVVSFTGVQDPSFAVNPSAPPLITQAVTVQDVLFFLQTSSAPGVYDTIFFYWEILVAVSTAVSLVCGTVLVYSLMRVRQIRQSEYKHFEAMKETVKAHDVPKTTMRWDKIVEQSRSDNDQARRLAILEADIMLGELLDTIGLRGSTMSDKMKTVDTSKFNTIDSAWEAHRARNRIAHEASYAPSGQEIRRIIALYERVFREFNAVE